MTRRRITVDAAFGKTPFETLVDADWVALTDTQGQRVKSAHWSIGRGDELEHFPPGTATVVLRNRDRALDPDYASSPYAGDLVPLVPVRIRSQDLDTLTYTDEFYGFVRDGWHQVLAPKGISDCQVELVDYLGVLAGYQLPDVFEDAILTYSPVGFWVLDGTGTGEDVPDLGSGQNDGRLFGEGVTLGDRVIAPGHTPAARFDNVIDATSGERTVGRVDMGRSQVASDVTTAMVVATFEARSADTDGYIRPIFDQGDGNGADSDALILAVNDSTDPFLFWHRRSAGSALIPSATGTIIGGGSHIAMAWAGNLKVDSVDVITDTTPSTASSVRRPGTRIGGSGRYNEEYWDGWIGVVALYADHTTVGDTGRAAILAAYTKLDGQTSDQHIAWALDQLGVPAGKRNLATGTVVMGPADTKGRDALAWMRLVAATEGGALYVDHRDGGKVRFTDRYHRFLNTRSTTSQATFADDNSTPHVRYPPEGLDIAPNGLDGMVNQATVQWAGGEVTVQDDTSIAAYGPRQRSIETVATTANHARSAGEWVVSRYKDPRSRIRGVTASARAMHSRDSRVDGLRVDDLVTFRVQPAKTGTVTEVDLFVDGIDHTAEGVTWETSFRLAPVDTFTPWIWGTSAWGTTKVWG